MLGCAARANEWRAELQRCLMRDVRCVLAAVLLSMIAAVPMSGAASVPFKGSWSGQTVSADGTNFPVVAVVSDGEGQLTHLGRYFMTSPHTSDVFTGETIGQQIFTAANGDQLTASCAGAPQPQPNGHVVGTLDCSITGGTGRFEGATGSYVFFLDAAPAPGGLGFVTEAQLTGTIAF
jgi:hypothetical protein